MECNRDEAIRAKKIAERKITERDYVGAKKFAVKAQSLYPGLDDLTQMLTTLDVYISAENKASGEVDWYGILGVNPSADDETVRKQYRKLALTLHPDKNKSVGADGAFKLLSEAWSVLSDKAKKLAYNQRRSLKGFQQQVPTQSGGTSGTANANGFYNFTKRAPSYLKTRNNSPRMHPTSVPAPSYQRIDTFWTICHRCKMHYEYLRVYLNHTLLCPNCHEAFLAAEMAPPFKFSVPQHQNSGNDMHGSNPFFTGRKTAAAQNLGRGGSAGPNSINHTNVQQGLFSGVTGTGNTEHSIAAKAANVVQRANEKMKREREEMQAGWEGNCVSSSLLKGEGSLKKTGGLYDCHSYGGNMGYRMSAGISGPGTENISGFRKSSFAASSIYSKVNSNRELTMLETRIMLMNKARMEIHKKLKQWSSKIEIKAADAQKGKLKESNKEKEKGDVKGQLDDLSRNVESSAMKRAEYAEKCFTRTSADDADEEDLVGAPSMTVPDPDFHDFDLDRAESSFGDNQVWAAYDDDDGMPRFYAIIHKVISRKPFKMKISWLNSKTSCEFGPIEWVGLGFSQTCGEFRVGKHEFNGSLNSFSHKVNWTKGTRGTVHIFPKKGDIWALYRNWSLDWNEHTTDEVIHKYDMVEVLDDYNEEKGVLVTPLIKVAGFRTVFHPHLEPEKASIIPKEEMFRFSHQVPNYLLTGQEAQNAPKGCQELDPAATPLELLQVITEVNVVPTVENGRKIEEAVLQTAPDIRIDEIVGDGKKGEEEQKVVVDEIPDHDKRPEEEHKVENGEETKR